MRLNIEADVDVSTFQIAHAFAEMTSDKQAEFLDELFSALFRSCGTLHRFRVQLSCLADDLVKGKHHIVAQALDELRRPMKITPEERALLQHFAGYVGAALGLPTKTAPQSMLYLVDRYIAEFDAKGRAQLAYDRRATDDADEWQGVPV